MADVTSTWRRIIAFSFKTSLRRHSTNLQRLGRVRLHDFPHVQDELTHVFPDLTPMKHEGVRHGPVGLLGRMVGCRSGLFLALGLRRRPFHSVCEQIRPLLITLKRG